METKDSHNKNFDQSEFHELEILKSVDANPCLNNRKAASKLGVSVKLAHKILTNMVGKGYLSIKKENSRNWHYFLTPNGFMEKARLTMSFFQFSMQFYKDARRKSAQLCRNLAENNRHSVILLGTGELAEITYLGIQEWKLEIVTVIDPDGLNENFMGYTTNSIDCKFPPHDAIIVCCYDPTAPTRKNFLPEELSDFKKLVWIFE